MLPDRDQPLARWPARIVASCAPNSGFLMIAFPHLILCAFPLLLWCSSLIARWNQWDAQRHTHHGTHLPQKTESEPEQLAASEKVLRKSGGAVMVQPAAASSAAPKCAITFGTCWQRSRSAEPADDGPAASAAMHSLVCNSLDNSTKNCRGPGVGGLERWTAVPRSKKRWRWRVAAVVLLDVVTALPFVYLHFATVRRLVAVMEWPSAVVSPGVAWLLPGCAALVAWRFGASK